MKDFIHSVTKKKKSRSSSKKTSRLIIGFIFLGLILIVSAMLLRALPWSDFFKTEVQTTVLLLTEKVDQSGAAVAQFQFDDRRVDLYPIPSDLPVEVMGGYGSYRFQAVYPLLKLEGRDVPFIQSTISLSAGVLLDQLWRANTPALDLTSPVHFAVLLLRGFWHNDQVPLTQKLAWLGLLIDQRTELVIHQPLVLLPAPEFATLAGRTESPCTIALINTTPLNGLAGRIAALLENQNFRVVRTVSDATPVEKTIVITASNLTADCQPVLEKLKKLVPGGLELRQDSAATLLNRADVVVKVGTDLAQQ